jgi:hypothetical protein
MVSTPRDPNARTAAQVRDLTNPAIVRARRAGLVVTASFQRDLDKVAVLGVARANGDTAAVKRATESLVAESVRIAQEANDPSLEPEHLRAARSSLCPLWPIC